MQKKILDVILFCLVTMCLWGFSIHVVQAGKPHHQCFLQGSKKSRSDHSGVLHCADHPEHFMSRYMACVRHIKTLPASFVKTISKKINLLLQGLKALSTKEVWIIDALLATQVGKICLEINATLRKPREEERGGT